MNVTVPCNCSASAETETIKQFTLSIFDSIESVGELQWNKYVPETNVLMQYDSLRLLQGLHTETMQFKYALAKKNEVTVGVMYFQVVMFHANQLINYFPEKAESNFPLKIAKSLSKKLLDRINVKLLVSGNVFMTGENGFYFQQDIDLRTRAKILRHTSQVILGNDPGIKAVLVSDLYMPKSEFDVDFKKCGYNEIYVESDMSIRLREEWKTFDDYLNSLASKYRVRAKKVFKLCNESMVTGRELSPAEIEQYGDRLFELYHRIIVKADFKLAELSKDFFRMQKRSLMDNYKIFAYFKDGEMIGFISAFYFGRKMEVHYTGMDMDLCKPLHLYQHMMYDMIRSGIEHRAERLHFGRTAPEIKSTIGANPSPMYGYVKHRNPLFNFFIARPYTGNLKPKNYLYRNPFKAV